MVLNDHLQSQIRRLRLSQSSIPWVGFEPDEIRTIMHPHMIRISEQLPQRGPERENGSEAGYLLKDSKRGPAFPAQLQG